MTRKRGDDMLVCFAVLRAHSNIDMQGAFGVFFDARLSAIWMRDDRDNFHYWRRGRDSNSRYPCEYAAFPRRCTRPLCDPSRVKSVPSVAHLGQLFNGDGILECI